MYTLTFEKHLPRTLKLSCIFELPEKPLKGSNVSPSAQVSCLIGLGRSLFFFFSFSFEGPSRSQCAAKFVSY